MLLTMGRKGTDSLWILGRSYSLRFPRNQFFNDFRRETSTLKEAGSFFLNAGSWVLYESLVESTNIVLILLQ